MGQGLLDVDRLRGALNPTRVGREIRHLGTVSSTNDEVWHRLRDNGADGLVVLAEQQTAGRGRLGRSWHAPRGSSLLLSAGLAGQPGDPPDAALGLIGAIAAHDAITSTTEVRPWIKWPNDLLVGARKLAGVLVESRRRGDGAPCHVLGIGINCLQQRGHLTPEIADRATSLELESAAPIDRTAVAIALIQQLDRWLSEERGTRHEALRTSFLERSKPLGALIELVHKGRTYRGWTVDLDPASALLVRLETGTIRVFSAADTSVVECGAWTSGIRPASE